MPRKPNRLCCCCCMHCCCLQVVASLARGSWFGGGEAVYGACASVLPRLQLVATGRGGELLSATPHTLALLGGPELMR